MKLKLTKENEEVIYNIDWWNAMKIFISGWFGWMILIFCGAIIFDWIFSLL